MDKSPEAFRTISEVAESLETPAHVLRFWESRFPQIKPVKRAGGRRYYRPADVALLGGIRHLLHEEGMTIRGVQKILREQGVRHVAAMVAGGAEADFDMDAADDDLDLPVRVDPDLEEAEKPETARVFALGTAVRRMTKPSEGAADVVALRAPVEPPAPDSPAETVDDGAADQPNDGIPMRQGVLTRPYPIDETVPEADHVFVEEDTEEPDTAPAAIFGTPEIPSEQPPEPPTEVPGDAPPMAPVEIPDTETPELPFDEPTESPAEEPADDPLDPDSEPDSEQLAQIGNGSIAARLRALPRPVSAATAESLTELHNRMGLLHAQIVEAQRLRR